MNTAVPPLPSLVHELKTLVQSMHPVVLVDTVEEERADALLRAVAAELRLPLFIWTATRGLQRVDAAGMVHGTADARGLLRHLSTLTVRGMYLLKDLSGHLGDPVTVRAFREAAQTCAGVRSTIVLTGPGVELPREIAHKAVPLHLRLPGRDELRDTVHAVVRALRQQQPFELALGGEVPDQILDALSGLTVNQARQAIAWAALDDNRLGADDVPRLVRRKGETIQEGGLLEFYPPGDNAFELGGFGRLKAWLERARVGFSAEAQALALPAPRGVLIAGVQGCGKSLAAKVIARTWEQPLLKLDAARLYDKYIGETEKNLRRALDVAEAIAPSVLWIDEIEKGFATGGELDGGVSKRLLGSFLTWLQERRAQVFVAATANDLSAVPPELLRKGRFDEVFFVDLPDAAEREEILRIHLRLRRQQRAKVDVGAIVMATDGFSGAEIEQAVVSSLYRSLHERRALTTDVLLSEVRETTPLSVARREDIERLRAVGRTRFVPVR